MLYTVLCTDLAQQLNWQCELLEYSWKRANVPGELIRLVAAPSGAPLPEHEYAKTLRIDSPHGRTGGYIALERLFSLRDWIASASPHGTVLIIDPDCVFVRSVEREVAPGSPVAQHWVDFRAEPPSQAATWPALIHTDDLRELLPHWIEQARAIFSATGRWESDMFSLVSAAANLRLRFSLDAVAAFVGWPDEAVAGAPIVHYCQDIEAADGRLLWSKRSYRPWSSVADPDQARHAYCRPMLGILNEFATLKSAGPERAGPRQGS